MKYLMSLVVLCLVSGCATMTPQEKLDKAYQECADLKATNKAASKECVLQLHEALHIPVRCTYLGFEGKQDEAQRCLYEAREQTIQGNLKQRQAEEQWRIQHPVDTFAPMRELGESWSRKPAQAPKPVQCRQFPDMEGNLQTICQ